MFSGADCVLNLIYIGLFLPSSYLPILCTFSFFLYRPPPVAQYKCVGVAVDVLAFMVV